MTQQKRTNSAVQSAMPAQHVSRATQNGTTVSNARELSPPPWVYRWLENASSTTSQLIHSDHTALATAIVANANRLQPADFIQATLNALMDVQKRIESVGCAYPIRFWNFLPDIHRTQKIDGQDRDRYMLFNEARVLAFRDWLQPDATASACRATPAASGVGHAGDDLLIHCLAMKQPGQSIENPRQIRSFDYSRRYGPKPPNFARATFVAHPDFTHPQLLVAGTASIVGEQSMHDGNLLAQIEETIANLKSLLTTAGITDIADPLAAFTSLRVYYRNTSDQDAIELALQNQLSRQVPVEFLHADICRRELLVEIEGLAELKHP